MKISIALVEPRLAINVGYIARIMKNFGLEELLLIKPSFNTNKARVFAMNGKDLLERAQITDFMELRKFDLLIGTTAMRAKSRLNIIRDSITPERLVSIVKKNSNACIVLGRESTGLTNKELSYCDLVLNIDTLTDYKTLNISHALAIILYELSKTAESKQKNSIQNKEMDLVIGYAMQLARISGYQGHKFPLLQISLRRILSRSMPTQKECMLIVSLLRDAVLALKRKSVNQ